MFIQAYVPRLCTIKYHMSTLLLIVLILFIDLICWYFNLLVCKTFNSKCSSFQYWWEGEFNVPVMYLFSNDLDFNHLIGQLHKRIRHMQLHNNHSHFYTYWESDQLSIQVVLAQFEFLSIYLLRKCKIIYPYKVVPECSLEDPEPIFYEYLKNCINGVKYGGLCMYLNKAYFFRGFIKFFYFILTVVFNKDHRLFFNNFHTVFLDLFSRNSPRNSNWMYSN